MFGINQDRNASVLRVWSQTEPSPLNSQTSPSPLNSVDLSPPTFLTSNVVDPSKATM